MCEGSGIWEYLQHDLLVKEERDDCAVMATRLAAMMSGACVVRMSRDSRGGLWRRYTRPQCLHLPVHSTCLRYVAPLIAEVRDASGG
jgi:hypothetical protein